MSLISLQYPHGMLMGFNILQYKKFGIKLEIYFGDSIVDCFAVNLQGFNENR